MLWGAASLMGMSESKQADFLCPAPSDLTIRRYCVCLCHKNYCVSNPSASSVILSKHHRESLSPPASPGIHSRTHSSLDPTVPDACSPRPASVLSRLYSPDYQSQPRYPNTLGPRNQDIVGLSASHRPFTSLFRDLETKCRCRRVVLILALPLP